MFTPLSPIVAILHLVSSRERLQATLRGIASDPLTAWAFAGMLLSGLISSIGAPNRAVAFFVMLGPLLIFFLVAFGRWGLTRPKEYLSGLVVGSGALGLLVIIAKLAKLELWVGTFPILGDFAQAGGRGIVLGMASNGLAALLEAGAVGGLGLAMVGKERRALHATAGFLALIGILITVSRGSIVGLAGAFAILLAFNYKKLKRLWTWVLVITLIVGALVSIWPFARERVTSIVSVSENVQRIRIWSGSLNMIKAKPLFGHGPGNFEEVYPAYRLPEEWEHANSPHNQYLYVLSGWGIVGAIIYFGYLGASALRPVLRRRTSWPAIACAMMATFWIHVIFDDLLIPHVAIIMGCMGNALIDEDEGAPHKAHPVVSGTEDYTQTRHN